MLKRDELANPTSCLNKARDDEPIFVLLGRDPAAPAAIRHWIDQRLRLGKNEPDDAQIAEAAALAIKLSVTAPGAAKWLHLAAVLRSRAQRMIEAVADERNNEAGQQRDNAELILVLARLLEGKPIAMAFGAPGDWGHENEIGEALSAAYNAARQRREPVNA